MASALSSSMGLVFVSETTNYESGFLGVFLNESVSNLGSLLVTDPIDITSISGVVSNLGSLLVTDLIDIASISGVVSNLSSLLVTDPIDIAHISGTVSIGQVNGSINVTESTDLMVAIGSVNYQYRPVGYATIRRRN